MLAWLGLTLVLSAAREWTIYERRIRSIHATLDQVVRVQARGMAASLWQYNTAELRSQAEGVLHYADLNYVEISDERSPIVAVGARRDGPVIERRVDLTFERQGDTRKVGTLFLQANSAKALDDVMGELAVTLASEAFAVACVTILLFALLQRSVIRHLSAAAGFVRRYDFLGQNAPLQLDKKPRGDELDTLVEAINLLRRNVHVAAEQQRVLFEHAPDAIVLFDVDASRFVDANRHAERLFGCSRGDILARAPRDFLCDLGPDGDLEIQRTLARALTGEVPVVERTTRGLDGRETLCEVRLVLLPTTGRRIVRASLLDITERKRSEAALLASERRFRDVLETIRLMALIRDVDGKVTFANACLCASTSWSRDEVLGADWFARFVPAATRAGERAAFLEAVGAETLEEHGESRVACRDGGERVVVWDHTLLRAPDGRVDGVASIGVDVTLHRSVEAQLRHAQKMEAIGHLAGGIAHDFNNLLTVTGGMSLAALRKMSESDPHWRTMKMISEASARATQLTRSLLAFSRKLATNPRDVDLNEVVAGVSGFLRRVIGEDIELVIVSRRSPLVVNADPAQLEQVLVNLATNSRDAMPEGGRLVIETRQVTFDEDYVGAHGTFERGRHVLLSVTDTGHGISPENRERLFEPFFTTKEVGKGTGLGLPIAYGIIEQHGGHIDVDSAVGQGTTFSIYLPLVERPLRAEAIPDAEPSLRRGSETILVAEDDPAVRDFVAGLLREDGYEVITAADGQEAIERHAARAAEIRLVLMDVIMPRMSGKEALKAMRERSPGTRALLISGYTADLIRGRAELEAGTDLMMKPLQPPDLLRRVRSMLDAAQGLGAAP